MNLYDFIQGLLNHWKPRLSRINASAIFQKNDVEAKVMGDIRSLEQVFNNLISNAIDAMPREGGILAIKVDEIVDFNQKKYGSDFLIMVPVFLKKFLQKYLSHMFLLEQKAQAWVLPYLKR